MWIRLASSRDVGRLDKDKRGGEGNGDRMTDTTCKVVCEWIGNEDKQFITIKEPQIGN